MNRILLLVGLMIVALTVAACNTVPEDIPTASVGDVVDTEEQQAAPEAVEDEVQATEEEVESEEDEVPQVQENNELGATAGDNAARKISVEQSSLEWEGYKPGSSHVGTFEDWEGTILFDQGQIVGLEGTVQLASVKSDSAGLDGHLQNDDFFNVEVYPTATFESTGIDGDTMSGLLTFNGVTREISFPITRGENTISTEFLLETEPFNFKYVLVNTQVRVAFTFTAE